MSVDLEKENKELKLCLLEMLHQFAYRYNNIHCYSAGLSCLEWAFTLLNIDEGITEEELFKKLEQAEKEF